MEEIASLAFAGLVLGITHALDADHVAAVSTIVSEKKRFWNQQRSELYGDLDTQ